MIAQEVQALAHVVPEKLQLVFRGADVGPQLFRAQHYVTSLAHGEVAQKRDDVSRNVNQQHATQPDVVVDEPDERTGDEATRPARRPSEKCWSARTRLPA